MSPYDPYDGLQHLSDEDAKWVVIAAVVAMTVFGALGLLL